VPVYSGLNATFTTRKAKQNNEQQFASMVATSLNHCFMRKHPGSGRIFA
jgi:hypothetical protein